MKKKVLIIGNHPIKENLLAQYCQRGDEVVSLMLYQSKEKTNIAEYSEIVLLADSDSNPFDADNKVMDILQQIATDVPEPINGKRTLCHLLLRSHSLLHFICLDGFCKEIEDKLEVIPFTMEDQWGRTIAMELDREPITKQTEKTVHLVIFGMSEVAEQVAINAAHVCHYPNYLQNGHSLRTRITVIDECAFDKSRVWIERYKHLFDNCYYRFVDTKKRPAVVNTSKPKYKDREDFVDVEWEFVSSSPYDKLVRDKISEWSKSQLQLLTIVFANDSSDNGFNDALHLPDAVIPAKIPIYVYMRSDKAFRQIKHSDNLPQVVPFGMEDFGYDVNIPIVKMAKNVNYIYDCCYEENEEAWNGRLRFSVEIDEEKKEQFWAKKSSVKRISNIYNAMTIGVKMHSMGFNKDDWDKFYDLSEEDIEILAEVEHNRWSVEELILGFRPCDDGELKEIAESIEAHNKKRIEMGNDAVKDEKTLKDIYKVERKAHYDLRAYNDLRPDGTGKPVQVYDRCLSACIPLIAKESRGGRV